MHTSRRQFLKASLGLVGSCGLGARRLPAAAPASQRLPHGLQLYAVRGAFEQNVPETLRAVSKIGYAGVEFWGYGGTPAVYQNHTAQQLRQMLDDLGLKCCGMHLQLQAIASDRLKRTMENNQVLGNPYLIVAAAPDKMATLGGIRELAGQLNAAAASARPENMRVGYHAHGFDFAKIDGRFAWDHLFSQTQPEVVMQMDIGNCLSGGGDPIAMLKKFPGRSQTVHVKEHEEKTFDSAYYRDVFELCETTCATRWYIVEMGSGKGEAFEVPKQALAKLRQVGK
jgi:sugar phosphate isomerase/epimerase